MDGNYNIDPEAIKWLGIEDKPWLLEIRRDALKTIEIPKDDLI